MSEHRASFRGHDVIAGFKALILQALPTVQVLDGPRTAEELRNLLVVIGWDPDAQASLIERRVDDSSMCDDPMAVGEVACFVTALRGDADMALARETVTDTLATIELALRDDDTGLGGACDSASLGDDVVLSEFQTGKGAEARLAFTVRYQAYL